jgi:uncharacterized peroxidase-related enzyme
VLPEYENLSRSSTRHGSSTSTNLTIIEEDHAGVEVSQLYEHVRSSFGRPDIPGLLKCFATHPPLLPHMMDLAESLLFADGYLIRRHKEMIATLISSQNACPYCADSHGYFLRVHGGSAEALSAIQQNNLGSLSLTAAEQALLRFAEQVNRSSHAITRGDVELLAESGWSELQIAEAVHIAALFATFNRVANAFGLPAQGLLALYERGRVTDQADSPHRERNGQ